MFDLGACAAMLILLLVLLVDFDTDGVLLWWSDVMTRVNRWPLGTWLGVTLKILAVLHGLAAVISGACLTRLAFVVWLWLVTVWAYLAGDGWIRRSRRAENPDGAGLK